MTGGYANPGADGWPGADGRSTSPSCTRPSPPRFWSTQAVASPTPDKLGPRPDPPPLSPLLSIPPLLLPIPSPSDPPTIPPLRPHAPRPASPPPAPPAPPSRPVPGGGDDPLGSVARPRTPAVVAEDLVERAFHQPVLIDPVRPLLIILAERAGQKVGQSMLDGPPLDAVVLSHGDLELLVPGQPGNGRGLEGRGGVQAACSPRSWPGAGRRRPRRPLPVCSSAGLAAWTRSSRPPDGRRAGPRAGSSARTPGPGPQWDKACGWHSTRTPVPGEGLVEQGR